MKKTKKEFSRIIEGLLFAASAPLTAENLVKYFEEEEKPALAMVKQILAELKTQYEGRGIELVEVASGFRFQAAKEVTPLLSKNMAEKPARYSRALLETLALIAYRQPITRGEIEDIRGVVVSSHIIKTLDEHEWIRVVGYKEVPGKPALYATTKTFLDHFGLKSLDELPPLAELKDFNSLEPLEFSNQIADMLNNPPEEALQAELNQEVEETLEGPVMVKMSEEAPLDEQNISEMKEEEIVLEETAVETE